MTAELPANVEAERELLGACLTLDNALPAVQAEVGLCPEDFYRRDHGVVFGAMLKLAGEGKPSGSIAVGDFLEKAGTLEEAGGRHRLHELELPSAPGRALYYAKLVRTKAEWRRRSEAGVAIREAALSEDSEKFAAAQGLLSEEGDRAGSRRYDVDRQRDLVYSLIDGRAKAEFFWPFSKLNTLQSGGMRRGQLIVLSGYTNEGKSHFAAQLLDHNRKHGRVCLYDNEMDPTEQAARRTTRHTGVPYGALLSGTLTEEQSSKVMQHLNSELHWPIVDMSGWTVEEVALDIRQHRWDFVVIDILHNFPFDNEREIAAAVARLKAAARLANCCVVLVSHVNRGGVQGGMRRRPVRSDLRWSGEIENLADAVCFVYRKQDEDTYEPLSEGAVYFDKCRGGKLGGLAVRFDETRLRFEAAA